MNKQTEELLDLASKGSTVARSIVPPGVRVGDIISNGWAALASTLGYDDGVQSPSWSLVTTDGRVSTFWREAPSA